MLGVNELLELEEQIKAELEDRFEEILIKLNQEEKLEDFLCLLGMQKMLGIEEDITANADGKIIVIGQSEVEKEKLVAVARDYGIPKDRFEFYLNYEDAIKFDFRKTQWSLNYSCILVGQMPHSGYSKGDYSSVITALEKQEGYPPVVRMGLNGLKISKTSFRKSLEFAFDNRLIA